MRVAITDANGPKSDVTVPILKTDAEKGTVLTGPITPGERVTVTLLREGEVSRTPSVPQPQSMLSLIS